VGLLLVGFSEQSVKKNLNLFSLFLVFTSTIVLLVVANLLRIVALVYFKSMAGTISHEMIGIASLLLYTLLPVYFLIYRKLSPAKIPELRLIDVVILRTKHACRIGDTVLHQGPLFYLIRLQ